MVEEKDRATKAAKRVGYTREVRSVHTVRFHFMLATREHQPIVWSESRSVRETTYVVRQLGKHLCRPRAECSRLRTWQIAKSNRKNTAKCGEVDIMNCAWRHSSDRLTGRAVL
jgi:hypothetical protein